MSGEQQVVRRASSNRWSRPASGAQIAALKAHGNYDGKYYSMGRASQTIGRSMRSGAGSGQLSRGGDRTFSSSSSSHLLSHLLGVPDELDALLAAALGQGLSNGLAEQDDDTEVRSVAFTVAPDESDPSEPRIVFQADVIRDPSFTGNPTLEVRFVSNVEFGTPLPTPRQGFISGVGFDD